MKHIGLGIVLIVIGLGVLVYSLSGERRRRTSSELNVWAGTGGGIVLALLGILFAARAI